MARNRPVAIIAHSLFKVSEEELIVESETNIIHHLASQMARLSVKCERNLLVYADPATLYPMILSVASALRSDSLDDGDELEERRAPLILLPYTEPPLFDGGGTFVAERELFEPEDILQEYVERGWVDDTRLQDREGERTPDIQNHFFEEAPSHVVTLGRYSDFEGAVTAAMTYRDEFRETRLLYSNRLSNGENSFWQEEWTSMEVEASIDSQDWDVSPTLFGIPILEEGSESPLRSTASRVRTQSLLANTIEQIFEVEG